MTQIKPNEDVSRPDLPPVPPAGPAARPGPAHPARRGPPARRPGLLRQRHHGRRGHPGRAGPGRRLPGGPGCAGPDRPGRRPAVRPVPVLRPAAGLRHRLGGVPGPAHGGAGRPGHRPVHLPLRAPAAGHGAGLRDRPAGRGAVGGVRPLGGQRARPGDPAGLRLAGRHPGVHPAVRRPRLGHRSDDPHGGHRARGDDPADHHRPLTGGVPADSACSTKRPPWPSAPPAGRWSAPRCCRSPGRASSPRPCWAWAGPWARRWPLP